MFALGLLNRFFMRVITRPTVLLGKLRMNTCDYNPYHYALPYAYSHLHTYVCMKVLYWDPEVHPIAR